MRRNGEQGFTLIELLLTLALSSLVVIGLMTVFWTSTRAYEWGTTTSDVQYMARRALSEIERDIKEGCSVTINPNGVNLLINKTEDKVIEYYLNKGNLYRKHKSSSVPIAEYIEEIIFMQTDDGLVEVRLKAQANDITYSLSTAVYPRMVAP